MLPQLPWLPWPPTYGLLVALGFVIGLSVARRMARRVGLPPGALEDVVVWACLAGLLGAKLLLVVLDPQGFLAAPWLLVTQAGVFYGGVLGAILWVVAHSLWRGLPPHAIGDACAPALPLAHAVGRLGCFAAGCCWGTTCDLPWGVRYTDPGAVVLKTDPSLAGVALHPVQVYEFVGECVVAWLAYSVLKRRRFPGQAWWTYVGAYALLRTGLEELRADPRGSFLGTGLSTSQGLSLVAGLVAVAMLVVLSRRSHDAPEAAPPEAPAVGVSNPPPPPPDQSEPDA